ncbi:type II/IV secretion system protein [Candidatus Peregrinibacteria bacterium]|nr:MAG: type II/IV secretion system protein [Candidatus Peregrinibacteria bacterium]
MFKSKSSPQVRLIDDKLHDHHANSFVYSLFKKSIETGASDIHIDLMSDEGGHFGFKVRYRVDGKCQDDIVSKDVNVYRGIVNKLKLDAGLKIDERRLPQDGRLPFEYQGNVYHFRLSFMPNTVANQQEEKIVLRQMADVKKCNLDDLGIFEHNLRLLKKSIQHPHGFVCVTGPTGSGKTTLLYALLKQIDRRQLNVMTLEDPIEAEIPLVNQSQMFHRIGYDFAAALRVILRQDPDIIMIGEMRDEETASKAFEAANTGHLVFSTLHTNTAASSITRLIQMNVPYYFISAALKVVVAQRLIRRVDPKTATPHPDAAWIINTIDNAFAQVTPAINALYQAARARASIVKANESTHQSGYQGRMALMEVMEITDDIRHLINFERGNEEKIQRSAIQNGMLTLQQYGYLQVLKGLTTFEEVSTATHTES